MDIGASPAELVFGTTLRILGEFVLPEDFSPHPHIFLEEFREHMRKVKPVPAAQKYKQKAFIFKELSSCCHVFLRDHARKALERPYIGPHKVLNRPSDRVFETKVDGASRHVSVENVKLAHFLRDDIDHLDPSQNVTHPDIVKLVLKTYSRKLVTFKQ